MDELGRRASSHLAQHLADIDPVSVAIELETLPDEAAGFLSGLPPEIAARVLEQMSPVGAQRALEEMSADRAGPILELTETSQAAALIRRLSLDRMEERLAGVSKNKAREIRDLASYPEDTAGSLMDPQVMAFRPSTRVDTALSLLRKLPQKRAREIFLIDEEGVVEGAVPLQELVVAEPHETLGELKGKNPIGVLGVASREEVIEALEKGEMASIVVVDINKRLLGVIRRDVLIKAVQEEATLDVQTMFGVNREERALSPSLFAVRRRLPWLVVNLGTAFLAAAVVGVFESTIARFTALAVLLPVVAGQSGNTGAQALAVTMRGLVLREVRVQQGFRLCIKELSAAFVNGIAVATITSAAVYLWNGSVGLTLVIGLSMVISMMAAGLSGAAIPLVLTAIRQDPAQSSSIILTTVTDVVGFLSFLGIATLLASQI